MSSFVRPTTFSFRITVIAFALALFADATNVVDIFAQSVVMHGDSDEDAPFIVHSHHSTTQLAQTAKNHSGIQFDYAVVLDQDSPSLAADAMPISLRGFITPSLAATFPLAIHPELSPIQLCVLRI
jgi:hypothetical protein